MFFEIIVHAFPDRAGIRPDGVPRQGGEFPLEPLPERHKFLLPQAGHAQKFGVVDDPVEHPVVIKLVAGPAASAHDSYVIFRIGGDIFQADDLFVVLRNLAPGVVLGGGQREAFAHGRRVEQQP